MYRQLIKDLIAMGKNVADEQEAKRLVQLYREAYPSLYTTVQNLNTTNNEDTTVSYRVIILRPDKTPSRVTLTPRFKTTDEASMYGFFRADDYDFELEECTVAANCILRDNKLVYVA